MTLDNINLRPGYTIPRLLKGNWQIAEDHSDALEEPKTEYFDVDDGKLVKKERDPIVIDEPYGHHLSASGQNQ